MTKVQRTFALQHALDDELLTRLADVNSIYGIERIQVGPSRMDITVMYDASRLRAPEVESALERAGLPITGVK